MSSESETGTHAFGGGIGLIIFVLALLGMGVGVGWFGLFPVWQAHLSGVKTQGIVKSLSGCDSSGDVVLPSIARGQIINNVAPTIQFTDLQNDHTYEVANTFCGNYAVGEPVTLWYTPSHPTTIFVEQDTVLWLIFAIVDVIMDLLALSGVGLVIYVFFFVSGTPAQAANQQNVSLSSSDQTG